MQYNHEKFSISDLVDTWKAGSLTRNDEYQRGAAWTLAQQQGLVDSVFREYPIPPLFLHEIQTKGLRGNQLDRFEIVDGQQRILALDKYFRDKYALLAPSDRKLRLPNSLRGLAAPWAEKRFADLTSNLRKQLQDTILDVFIISDGTSKDEVRDLFIRLQSGTALTRQQIRDAWPGAVGPYIVKLAGKLDRVPDVPLFFLLDKRGARGDEERDPHALNRQFCAQLLCLFLARQRDSAVLQGIGANDLDQLYHDNTDFKADSVDSKKFQEALGHAFKVFKYALANNAISAASKSSKARGKFKKLDIISTVLLIQDLSYSSDVKLDQSFYQKLADHLSSGGHDLTQGGRPTSGSNIVKYYHMWREKLPEQFITRLDPKRYFDEQQKTSMYENQNGRCAICSEEMSLDEADADHHPTRYSFGGKTDLDNGRLVHKTCHERGRLAVQPASQDGLDS